MVCSLGSGKMAAMARLLAAESLSQATTEEIGHQKFTAQFLQRELQEADEANLLDEEDMHVFGLKPMGDPLHLVLCSACRKPVKASQYAAHSELCRLVYSTAETISELDGGAGHKKPPRKERRKLLTGHAKQAATVGKQEKCESVGAANTTLTKSHLIEQVGLPPSLIGASTVNGDQLVGALLPPTKRSKLIAAECLPLSDDLGVSRGVTDVTCMAEFDAATTVPVPLATKMYYSLRNQRFRSALSHLFHAGMTEEHSDISIARLLVHCGATCMNFLKRNNFEAALPP